MPKNIKQKLFSSCALVQWKEDHHTICAHVTGRGCIFSIKCRTCGLKNKMRGHLLSNLMNKWRDFKPCQH